MIKLLAKDKHLTIKPKASSTGLASTCLSTGFTSIGCSVLGRVGL